MMTFKNEDAVGIVKKNLGGEAVWELGAFLNGDFMPFRDLERAIQEDVAFLKGSKLIPGSIKISGWIYDVEIGKVRQVA